MADDVSDGLEKRFQKDMSQEQVERRSKFLREAPIYDGIQAALGSEFYQKYEARTTVADPSQIHPRFAEFLQINPSVKVEAINNPDGTTVQYVMNARINDRLSSIVFLNTSVQNAKEVTLGGSWLDQPVYDYLIAKKSMVINQFGKVLDLDNYLPEHPREKEKEVRILLTDLKNNISRSSPRRIAIDPLISLNSIESFIHEGGHMAAYDVNRSATKYSTDRDAAAYLITAARELERRGFLDPQDANQIIDIQRKQLETYQEAQGVNTDEKEGFINVLSGTRSYTKEATNLSRSLDLNRRNPERRKGGGMQELRTSLKELVPHLVDQVRQLQEKYDLTDEPMNMLRPNESKFFKTKDSLFKVQPGWNEVIITEYFLTEESRLYVKQYSLRSNEMEIIEAAYNEKTQYFDNKVKQTLNFSHEGEESEIIKFMFERAKKRIADLIDDVEKRKVQVVTAKPMDLYAILGEIEAKAA